MGEVYPTPARYGEGLAARNAQRQNPEPGPSALLFPPQASMIGASLLTADTL